MSGKLTGVGSGATALLLSFLGFFFGGAFGLLTIETVFAWLAGFLALFGTILAFSNPNWSGTVINAFAWFSMLVFHLI